MLAHAEKFGVTVVDIKIDDGWSGASFQRPAFIEMMEEIRAGKIDCVLVKDLSRLGRNYLEVGNLAEVFLPEHDCELISLNEKLDEMAVFRNWFNELHGLVNTFLTVCA